MSQNRHINQQNRAETVGVLYRFLLICALGILFLSAFSAEAASNTGLKVQKNPIRVLKTDISALTRQDTGVLDWKSQELEVFFDLPQDGWYESLDLFLTAIPEGSVSRTAPITVSYNGEKPIPLYGKASRFDAHIKLDPARIRTSRNVLKIAYKTPHKEACLTPEHGKWMIDFSRSKLVTKTRAKSRATLISEIEPRLAHPMTAPKRISIRAAGSNKIALEALAAQAIAGRMTALPSFQFTSHNSDFDLVAGTRDEIRSMVIDKNALSSDNANVFMDKGSRPKLVVTGHDEIQVETALRNLAAFHLPKVRRRGVMLNEFNRGQALRPRVTIAKGKFKLGEIGDTTFPPSWRPKAAQLAFNVADPTHSEGKLVLDLSRSEHLDSASTVRVLVNEQSIGYTKLDKRHKSVSFDIEPGMFMATSNSLKIEPVFAPRSSSQSCSSSSHDNSPALFVSERSKLSVKSRGAAPILDLSRFAASGMPSFDKNKDTVLVMTAKTRTDRAASLKFLAYAAQQFGPSLVNAQYSGDLASATTLDKNILIVGPNALSDPNLLAAAPTALKLALRGKPASGTNTLQTASLDRYAANGSTSFKTAQKSARNARISNGGIASLFASPYHKNRLIGVITSDRPSQFSLAMRNIAKPGYWNGLQGSVARWNSNSIMMAQIGLPGHVPVPATSNTQSLKDQGAQAWTKVKDWAISLKPKSKNPGIPEPKTTATLQNNAVVTPTPKNPVVKLRGAINVDEKQKWAGFDNVFSDFSFPSMDELKTSIQSKYVSAEKSFKKISAKRFDWRPVKSWMRARTQDRNTILFIIALSLFLMLGMASPKLSED